MDWNIKSLFVFFFVSVSTLINSVSVLEAQVSEGCANDLYTQPPHLSDRRIPLRGVCWITLTDACLWLPLDLSAAPWWELSSAVNTIGLCHPGESQKTAFWRVTVQQTQTRLFWWQGNVCFPFMIWAAALFVC